MVTNIYTLFQAQFQSVKEEKEKRNEEQIDSLNHACPGARVEILTKEATENM